tara:strand:- start:147 stop:3530 length:3384 start_codon:yes stop_codon:yes gene_type:complete
MKKNVGLIIVVSIVLTLTLFVFLKPTEDLVGGAATVGTIIPVEGSFQLIGVDDQESSREINVAVIPVVKTDYVGTLPTNEVIESHFTLIKESYGKDMTFDVYTTYPTSANIWNPDVSDLTKMGEAVRTHDFQVDYNNYDVVIILSYTGDASPTSQTVGNGLFETDEGVVKLAAIYTTQDFNSGFVDEILEAIEETGVSEGSGLAYHPDDLDRDGFIDQLKNSNGFITHTYHTERDGSGNVLRRIKKETGTGEVVEITEYNSDGKETQVQEFLEYIIYTENPLGGELNYFINKITITSSYSYFEDSEGHLIEMVEYITEDRTTGDGPDTTITSRYDRHGLLLWKIYEDSEGNLRMGDISFDSYPWKGNNQLPTMKGRILEYQTLKESGFITRNIIKTLEKLDYGKRLTYSWNRESEEWVEKQIYGPIFGSGELVSREYDLDGNLVIETIQKLDDHGDIMIENFGFDYVRDSDEVLTEIQKWRLNGNNPLSIVETFEFAEDEESNHHRIIHNQGGISEIDLEIEYSYENGLNIYTETRDNGILHRKISYDNNNIIDFIRIEDGRGFNYDHPRGGDNKNVNGDEIKYTGTGEIVLEGGIPKVHAKRKYNPNTGYVEWVGFIGLGGQFIEEWPVDGSYYETIIKILSGTGIENPFEGKDIVIATNDWLDNKITGGVTTRVVNSFNQIGENEVVLSGDGGMATRDGDTVVTLDPDGLQRSFEKLFNPLGQMTWNEFRREDLSDLYIISASINRGDGRDGDSGRRPYEHQSYIPDSVSLYGNSYRMYRLINEFFRAFPEAKDWMKVVRGDFKSDIASGIYYRGGTASIEDSGGASGNTITTTLIKVVKYMALITLVEPPESSLRENLLAGSILIDELSNAYLKSTDQIIMGTIIHEIMGHGTIKDPQVEHTIEFRYTDDDRNRLEQLTGEINEIYQPLDDFRDLLGAETRIARENFREARLQYFEEHGFRPDRDTMSIEDFYGPEYYALIDQRDKLREELDGIAETRNDEVADIRLNYKSYSDQWAELYSRSKDLGFPESISDYSETGWGEFQAEWARVYFGTDSEKEYREALKMADQGNDGPLRAIHLLADSVSTRDTTRFYHLNGRGEFTTETVRIERNVMGRITRIILPD